MVNETEEPHQSDSIFDIGISMLSAGRLDNELSQVEESQNDQSSHQQQVQQQVQIQASGLENRVKNMWNAVAVATIEEGNKQENNFSFESNDFLAPPEKLSPEQ